MLVSMLPHVEKVYDTLCMLEGARSDHLRDLEVLLGLLKHPTVTITLEGHEFTDARRGLERLALRGPRLRDFTRARAKLLKARSPRSTRLP